MVQHPHANNLTSRVLRDVSVNAQPVVPEGGICDGRCPERAAVRIRRLPSHPDLGSTAAPWSPARYPGAVQSAPERIPERASQPALQPALQPNLQPTPEAALQPAVPQMAPPRDPNYLSAHVDVTAEMRMTLIEWIVYMATHMRLHAATYFLAVDIVDRYLAVSPNVPRAQLNVIGITAVFIAAKHEQQLEADDCAGISAPHFTEEQVLDMERTILAALGVVTTVTTPYPLLAHLLSVSQAPTPVRHAAMYFLEHAVLDYAHLRFPPSQLANASLYLAHLLLQREPWPSELQRDGDAQRVGDFIECARNLLDFVIATADSSHQGIRSKYSRAAHSEVAQLPLPDPQLMMPDTMPSLPPAAPHCPVPAAASSVDVATPADTPSLTTRARRSCVDAKSVPALAQEVVGKMDMCREQLAPPRNPNYLSAHVDVTAKMRMTLIDWFVDVAKQFRLHASTYFSAVDVVDRYLAISPNVPRSQLQLVGISAVLIAAKHEEKSEAVWAPSADDCARITANTFTADQVLAMERMILAALGAVVTVPTPYPLLVHLLDASQAPTPVRHAAMYFLEHAVLDYGHLRFLPSQLASASLYLANLLLQREPWPSGLRQDGGAQRVGDFIGCARNLLAFVTAAVGSPHQAIRRKYSRDTYSGVTQIPLPDVAAVQSKSAHCAVSRNV